MRYEDFQQGIDIECDLCGKFKECYTDDGWTYYCMNCSEES